MAQSTFDVLFSSLNRNPAFGIDDRDELHIKGTVTEGVIAFPRTTGREGREWTITHYSIEPGAERAEFYWSTYDIESKEEALRILQVR